MSVTACPRASLVLSLVILSVILDTYLLSGYNYHRSNTVILVLVFIFIITVSIFLVWLANKTCYDYTWLSWIVLIYLFFGIIDTIASIINPEKRNKELKEIDEILNSSPTNGNSQNK
jgi:phosphoglycerol transferase MdoB-like AlkP superfamily enzyme